MKLLHIVCSITFKERQQGRIDWNYAIGPIIFGDMYIQY